MPADSDEGRTVFVVDDEPAIAEIISERLRTADLDVYTFHDGQSALDSANATPPDLVVSDVNMPRMGGVELAAELHKLCPDCKIILMSGATPRAAGIEILQKPLDVSALLEVVLNKLRDP